MQSSAVFRHYAQECLRVAGVIGSQEEREVLVGMAARLHAMAQEREREERASSDPFTGTADHCRQANLESAG